MPTYDKRGSENTGGRSKETDQEAYDAMNSIMQPGAKVNAEDGANTNPCPAGNPEDPSYSRTRTIPGPSGK